MNYFAHAYRFLDDPYFVAGTAVPDWLSVADRAARVRAKHAGPAAEDPDPIAAAVARGALQHLRDDARFHETPAFSESVVAIARLVREASPGDASVRAGFLGHLLLEVLLDAALIAESPGRLDEYYRLLDQVDVQWVQEAVNRFAVRPTDRLAGFIAGFRQARVLWDYLEDAKLMARLNQVMRRVGLEPLPDRLQAILPDARRVVTARRDRLLEGIPTHPREMQIRTLAYPELPPLPTATDHGQLTTDN